MQKDKEEFFDNRGVRITLQSHHSPGFD